MRIYLTCLFFVYITLKVSGQQLDCPAGWLSNRYDPRWPCYLITNKIQRTWLQAQTFCEQMGGGLWKIDSLREKNWIYNLLNVYHGYYPSHVEWWLGLHDNPTGIKWADKSTPNMQILQPWVSGEPNTYDRSKVCVQYYNGSLRHEDCQQNKYFICERARGNAVFCDARKNWESINGKCYKAITKLSTWDDAQGECKKENADLMIVDDIRIEKAVHDFIESRRANMWFGLRAFKANGTYSYRWQNARGTSLNSVNSFWSSQIQLTSTALQTVKSSNGVSACVIANYSLPSPNFWEPADCGIRAFSLCQKPQGRCASGWLSNGYYCYQIITWYSTSWSRANSFCTTQGAKLVRIRANSTQLFINGLLPNLKAKGVNAVWMGLTDNNQNGGSWSWSDGTKLSSSFNNFNGQTPNNRPGVQDCFHIFTDDTNGTWQIATSCASNNSFICEISRGVTPKLPPTLTPTGSTRNPNLPTTSPVPVTWSTDCGPLWVKNSKNGYCYKFSDNTLDWFQAQSACQSEGGQLASINNYDEERFISDHLFGFNSPALWIGMNDLNSQKGYHWVDGTGVGYFNWAPGEPNDSGYYERCAEIIVGGPNRGRWNDARCDSRKGHVCKRRETGEPNNFLNVEKCATILPRGQHSGQWNDDSCSKNMGYICKKRSKGYHTSPPPRTPSLPAGKIYGCPSNLWIPYKGNCYYFSKTPTNWMNARKYCQGKKAELASILNENDQNFVFSQIPVTPVPLNQLFIGLNDLDLQMKFTWTDGKDVTYTNWAVNEPNNWQNRQEDCVAIYHKDGTWNDAPCESPKQGFVCKTHKAILPQNTPQYNYRQTCPFGFLAFGYNCYQLMAAMSTWQSAAANCKARGAHLVVIKDRYQQAFLASQIGGRTGFYWTGLSHNGASGSFQWVTGESLSFTSWSANHTGNNNNSCIAMKTSGPGIGLWLDMPCTSTMKYICETQRTGFNTAVIPTTSTITPPVCPSSWGGYKGYCYKVFNADEDKKSYFDAKATCQSMGADLVSLHSSGEQSFVFSNRYTGYYSYKTYWIGLNDFDTEKGYKWSDGSAVNYTSWGTGEPNDADGSDDCVEYNSGMRKWNDNSCYLAKNFACKIKLGVQLKTTLATPPPTNAPECDSSPGWKLYNGSCYYVNTPKSGPGSRMTWFDARDYCTQNGGDLVSIHSLQENGFVTTIITQTVQSDCWIGFTDVGVNKFGWSDSSPSDFIHWTGGEPNDAYGAEKCAQIKSSNSYWNDNDCNEKYHFVCKRPTGNAVRTLPPSTTPIDGGCPNRFSPVTHGNKCYKLIGARNTAKRRNYTSARDTCRQYGKGYDIASVNNHLEQASLIVLINGMMTDQTGVWIGMNDLNNNQEFTWQDSTRLKFTNWDKNEPQSRGKCVEMYTDIRHAGKWHNIDCSDQRPFICEVSENKALKYTPPPCTSGNLPAYIDNNIDCYKLDLVPRTWQDAMSNCQKDGTMLTSAVTVYEQAFLDTLMGAVNTPVWIGLADINSTGTYMWQDKNIVRYTSWDKNEPTFGAGKCVATKNGYWNDQMCTTLYPSICKKPYFTPFTPKTPNLGGYCRDVTWKQHDTFCYFLSLNQTRSFADAARDCTSRGMQLASVSSKTEENAILHMVDNDPTTSINIWIGFRKLGGFFSWIDNSAPSYVNWLSGPTGKDCVMMRHIDGKWQDSVCTSRKGYICKTKKLPPTTAPPTTTTLSTSTTTSTTTTTTSPPLSSTSASSTLTSSTSSSINKQSPITAPTLNTAIVHRSSSAKSNTGNNPFSRNMSGPTVSIPSIADKQRQNQNQSNGDLSAGQVVGVVIGVLILLAIICAALMVIKRRRGGEMFSWQRLKNIRLGGNDNGFDNATYDKGLDKVNINNKNGHIHSNGTNGHVSNGNSVGFQDISEDIDC